LNNIKLTLNINQSVFVAFSIYNLSIPFNDIIIHSCDTRYLNLKLCNCQKLIRVTRVKYFGLIIDCNLRWKLLVKNLVMRLRSIISKSFQLNKLLPTEILRIVYSSQYKSVFQYDLLVLGSCTENTIRILSVRIIWFDNYIISCQVGVVFTDFKKAFDTVEHGVLINELDSLGIGDPLLSWLCSYLSNRQQFAKVNNCKSSLVNIPSGVPQGGHRSPLLFILFIYK